ncbi:tRNA glutamyl-Q(34) synthetase GluQRS [Roseibium aggregatum]|uniref:tRNA glutamyl-Q(34) synthetase GluQRS n=1 Tax=Roseibium aggregatum TaxID=187304 RepID=A0A926P4J2_9HYPH|nr:tRNA glutamyl-Q(34) synthetase GluQRS [Roseibium aggregatum]MBD1546827.1 tRNA glutamyl-Q(34) synthetase GluQRS [Roseibium aggregatum]
MTVPVFRFAPSPNGHLHLGHAYSALLNYRSALATGGRFLLRVEDIDTVRCTPELERDMLEDLAWLGLTWETPVLRQSENFADYEDALQKLEQMGVTYRAYLTRGEIKRFVAEKEAAGASWPHDPDGAPHYPGDRAVLSDEECRRRADADAPFAVRLDMRRALELVREPLTWRECSAELPASPAGPEWFEPDEITAAPDAWGDVILARKDTPTSYHLSVVVDDARQGVTDVMRGRDLYHATSVHRLLQILLGLPQPRYRHHRLILDHDGRKLAKSDRSTSLRELRMAGHTAEDVRERIGIPDDV